MGGTKCSRGKTRGKKITQGIGSNGGKGRLKCKEKNPEPSRKLKQLVTGSIKSGSDDEGNGNCYGVGEVPTPGDTKILKREPELEKVHSAYNLTKQRVKVKEPEKAK